jgi:hypothetical protein
MPSLKRPQSDDQDILEPDRSLYACAEGSFAASVGAQIGGYHLEAT